MKIETDTVESVDDHTGEVYAVAGLGNPDRFFGLLQTHGIQFSKKPYPDHHHFTPQDFAFANQDSVIYMTEKDAVKCEAISIPGRVIVVSIDALLPESFYTFVFDRLDAIYKQN